jgi:signal transduction histidine kinase
MAKILIVDDDLMVRTFLKRLLSAREYELCEAEQGMQGLRVAHDDRPDLIITDILMSEMDGFEFIRRLRADPHIGTTPAIFYTSAYHSIEALSLAEECGVHHVLEKPVRAAELFQAIEEALGAQSGSPAQQDAAGTAFDAAHLQLLNQKLMQKVRECEQLSRKLEVLTDTGRRMIVEHDLERMIQVFCVAARDILVAKAGVIRIFGGCNAGHYFAHSGLDRGEICDIEAIAEISRFIEQLSTGSEVQTVAESGKWSSGRNHVRSFLGVPISSSGERFGMLYVVDKLGSPSFGTDDQLLASLVAAQVAVTYENAARHEQVQAYLSKLQMVSRNWIDAQETERRRVARELHDGVGQALTAIKINLQAFGRAPFSDFKPHLDDALMIVDQLTEEVRTLSLELRPSILDDLGLLPALQWHVGRFSHRSNCEVQLVCDSFESRLPLEIETACFRITQEALNNISKHARARHVTIELLKDRAEMRLIIRDDGTGFNVAEARGNASRGNTVGLLGMEERMRLLGGTIEIDSSPSRGAEIRARFPLS